EMGANRGIYHDGWMASALSFVPWNPVHEAFDPDKQKWELYNIKQDFSQANDLAGSNPQKLRELQDLWWAEAAKYHVLPMDWRVSERFNSELAGRPSLAGKDRKVFTYYPGQVGLPKDAAPRILNRSWSITADLDIPDSGAEGMITTNGGIVGGYGLYVLKGKPVFVYNNLALERPTITGSAPLPKGKVKLVVDFVSQGKPGEFGKGAVVTLSVNGAKVGEMTLARTIPAQISLNEGMDIGQDVGSPVDFNYEPPFKFTGTIEKVTYELK